MSTIDLYRAGTGQLTLSSPLFFPLNVLFYTHFQVNSDTSDIESNVKSILSYLQPLAGLSISEKDWGKCRIAIVEGFTNAVYHAHQDLPLDTPIHIELTGYSDYLEICIWDCGPPFDLLAYLAALPAQPDQDDENGRGLRIIDKVADELKFHSWDFSAPSCQPTDGTLPSNDALPIHTEPEKTDEHSLRVVDQVADELNVYAIADYKKCLIFVKYRTASEAKE